MEISTTEPVKVQSDSVGNWLWRELMDYCKKNRFHPGDNNDLFSIVTKAREKFPGPQVELADKTSLEKQSSSQTSYQGNILTEPIQKMQWQAVKISDLPDGTTEIYPADQKYHFCAPRGNGSIEGNEAWLITLPNLPGQSEPSEEEEPMLSMSMFANKADFDAAIEAPKVPDKREDGMPSNPEERRLRRMLCASRHSTSAYMDDGEASYENIDYMRHSLDQIEEGFMKLRMKQFEEAQKKLESSRTMIFNAVDQLCREAHPGWDSSAHYGEIAKMLRRCDMAASIVNARG